MAKPKPKPKEKQKKTLKKIRDLIDEKPTLADLKLYEVTLSDRKNNDYTDGGHEFVAAISMTDAAALFDGASKTRIINIEELCAAEYFHLTTAASNAVSTINFKTIPKVVPKLELGGDLEIKEQ